MIKLVLTYPFLQKHYIEVLLLIYVYIEKRKTILANKKVEKRLKSNSLNKLTFKQKNKNKLLAYYLVYIRKALDFS